MNFGTALEALKQSKKVARTGWNGPSQYLFYLPSAVVPIENIHTEPLRSIAEANGGSVECLPAIRLKNAQEKVMTGWVPTVSDLLAEDWCVLCDRCDGQCELCDEECEYRF